jgi:hypothetical protein
MDLCSISDLPYTSLQGGSIDYLGIEIPTVWNQQVGAGDPDFHELEPADELVAPSRPPPACGGLVRVPNTQPIPVRSLARAVDLFNPRNGKTSAIERAVRKPHCEHPRLFARIWLTN